MGGYDYPTLNFKVQYSGIQIGIYLIDEYNENLKLIGIDTISELDIVPHLGRY
jgi:hypothetical protein